MTRDASLDDFATDGETEDSGESPDSDPGTGSEPVQEPTPDADPGSELDPESGANSGPDPGEGSDPDLPPASPTHGWSPEGAVCTACEESVVRRWRSESTGGMVCDDCKEW